MTYRDDRLKFGDTVDMSSFTVGDNQIGDSINLWGDADAGPGQWLEKGTEIPLLIQIMDDVDSAGDGATIQFVLQGCSDNAFSSPSPVDVWSSGVLPQATMVAGYRVPRAYLASGGYQYVRLIARVGVENLTDGDVSAWVQTGRQTSV